MGDFERRHVRSLDSTTDGNYNSDIETGASNAGTSRTVHVAPISIKTDVMPTPTSSGSEAKPHNSGTEVANHKRRMLWILCGGAILLAISSVGGYYVSQYASNANVDMAPLPRVLINAPFIKTPDIVVDKMVELGEVTAKDLVYDLGCGDGRLVIGAAVKSGCRGIGFDIDAERIAEATVKAEQENVDQLVSFQEQDIFAVDLAEADVILVYLLPWMMEKLTSQFENCRPGTRIVSHDFEIKGYAVDKTISLPVDDDGEHYIYLYVTPLHQKTP